jgi:hypothetical protein
MSAGSLSDHERANQAAWDEMARVRRARAH